MRMRKFRLFQADVSVPLRGINAVSASISGVRSTHAHIDPRPFVQRSFLLCDRDYL